MHGGHLGHVTQVPPKDLFPLTIEVQQKLALIGQAVLEMFEIVDNDKRTGGRAWLDDRHWSISILYAHLKAFDLTKTGSGKLKK